MKSFIATAIVLGLATACSVQRDTVQRPTPPPTAPAVTPDPVRPPGTTAITTSPGTTMVIKDSDPPQRVQVSR